MFQDRIAKRTRAQLEHNRPAIQTRKLAHPNEPVSSQSMSNDPYSFRPDWEFERQQFDLQIKPLTGRPVPPNLPFNDDYNLSEGLLVRYSKEVQLLIEQFGLPPVDVHRMMTPQHLFEWLFTTIRELLELRIDNNPANHTHLLLELEFLRKECELLKENNRLLQKSEATANLKFQEIKYQWRLACERMKSLQATTDGRCFNGSAGLGRSLSRNSNRYSQVANSDRYELKSSRSQKLFSMDSSTQQPWKVNQLSIQIDYLNGQLESRGRRIAELQNQLFLKDEALGQLSQEFDHLVQKLRLLENVKHERTVFYEQELLEQIRRVSGESKQMVKQVTQPQNLSGSGDVKQQPAAFSSTWQMRDLLQEHAPCLTRKEMDQPALSPRLTFSSGEGLQHRLQELEQQGQPNELALPDDLTEADHKLMNFKYQQETSETLRE